LIDTHSHIYAEEFDADRDEMIQRALNAGLKQIILPNVDSKSLPRMLEVEQKYPDICFATIGLHPTSVNNDYKTELEIVKVELERRKYIAIGEIGIDLYWDKSFFVQQKEAFEEQLQLSLKYNIPVIIHVRESFNETFELLEKFRGKGLKGVFHSFTGNKKQMNWIENFGGFFLGINGIVTFKNSELPETLKFANINTLLMETDAPYLTPTPFRGKRNEPAFITLVRKKLSEMYKLSEEEISEITHMNALKAFPDIEF
jgi:TatD DNase family protein